MVSAIPTTPRRDGFLDASTYASKYGVEVECVRNWMRTGKIRGYSLAEGGAVRVFVEDAHVPAVRPQEDRGPDMRRCNTCMAWLLRKEFSGCEWGHLKHPCRMCRNLAYQRRKGREDQVDRLISASNRAAEIEKAYTLTDRQRVEREQSVVMEAARIEAAGLAGDGEGWPDE